MHNYGKPIWKLVDEFSIQVNDFSPFTKPYGIKLAFIALVK